MLAKNKIRKKDMPILKKEYRLIERKKKIRYASWCFILLIGIFITSFGVFKMYLWQDDNRNIDREIAEIEKVLDNVVVEEDIPLADEIVNSEELVNPPEKVINVTDDYWEYIKLPLMKVNFNELLEKNDDTVAFLKVSGTNINYPIVQTVDNTFYLNHSYDKSKNNAGWVFMDYRNSTEDWQDNTIIYAHGRQNKTMFGTLKQVIEDDWYQSTENHVLYLTTPTKKTLWQVFSTYVVPEETYYLTSQFGSLETHQEFIDTILSRSLFNFNTSVDTNDKILTLSTCYNSVNRVVLHAKLIKSQNIE